MSPSFSVSDHRNRADGHIESVGKLCYWFSPLTTFTNRFHLFIAKLMSAVACALVQTFPRASLPRVLQVVGHRQVFEIVKSIIRWLAVYVVYGEFRMSNKRQHHETVDLETTVYPVFEELHSGITERRAVSAQDLRLSSVRRGSRNAANSASIANLVKSFILRNCEPILHDFNYTRRTN